MRQLRVLLVEDSEFDAVLLVRYLQGNGYATRHQRVASEPEMEKALAEQEWDVVLCDYQMPHFAVPPALALLKRKGLDLPFIIVSGSIGEELAVDLMRAGAHDFIVKGRLSRLIPAIERELREAEARRERAVALSKIKTLSGLLPICASCKKIRNDQGYWQKLETFVREHSGAEFSHSICPDCMKQLYPQFTFDFPPGEKDAD